MKKTLVIVVAMFTMLVFASVSMAQAPVKSDKPTTAAPEKPAAAATDKTKSESPKAEKKTDEKKPEEKKSAPAEKKG